MFLKNGSNPEFFEENYEKIVTFFLLGFIVFGGGIFVDFC
jgi:hypothetical protein